MDEPLFGLYLVPDDSRVFGRCESVSFGVDWGGPHVTLCGFHGGNEGGLRRAVEEWRTDTRWTAKGVKVEPKGKGAGTYRFGGLEALATHLQGYGVHKVRDGGWHVHLSGGFTGNAALMSMTTWSLCIIRRDGDKVTYLRDTLKPF